MSAHFALVAAGLVVAFARVVGWPIAHVTPSAQVLARATDASAARRFDVTHYDVQLRPQVETKTIAGTVTITLVVDDADGAVVLNRGNLQIDAVREGADARAFEVVGNTLRVSFGSRRPTPHLVTIAYHGAPTSGLVFVPEREQIYTLFSTSQWMPAVDDPDARATLRLRLTIPRDWTGAASGTEIRRQTIGDGPSQAVGGRLMQVIEWRQQRPVPTYTFGFAVARFATAIDRTSRVTLRYFGNGFTPSDLRRVFGETARMIAFFESRAGVPLPGGDYAQALVARTAGQEMAGLSVLSDDYGRAVLNDPTAIGLIAHELAHQWWGNMVTCRGWTHFWLNEGLATYMAAAYREHRFGRDVYLRDVAATRERYEQVRDRGNDRPLVFPDWNRPSADDRTLVYQKGAYVLHELRESLGDARFWAGLRLYTTRHFGQSVTTPDLQAAMEEAGRTDLTEFFKRYVY